MFGRNPARDMRANSFLGVTMTIYDPGYTFDQKLWNEHDYYTEHDFWYTPFPYKVGMWSRVEHDYGMCVKDIPFNHPNRRHGDDSIFCAWAIGFNFWDVPDFITHGYGDTGLVYQNVRDVGADYFLMDYVGELIELADPLVLALEHMKPHVLKDYNLRHQVNFVTAWNVYSYRCSFEYDEWDTDYTLLGRVDLYKAPIIDVDGEITYAR